ncbi:MAG TPA: cardiolipin synthase [Thermoanaerobaculia bacterium]
MERTVTIPVVLFAGLILIIVVLLILIWSVKRRSSTHYAVREGSGLEKLLPSLVGITAGSLIEGNRIEILQNGRLFPVLLRDIEGAQETIHFESYVWWKGKICEEIAAALAKKAREGVEVRVLLDASGSSRMDEKLWKQMGEAGCKLAKFHPVRLSNIGRLNNRDHRKIVVIDGEVGFVGGHGVAEEWTGNAQDSEHWRDTFLRIEGPLVGQIQAAFSENWIEETGEVPAGQQYFKRLPPAGPTAAHVSYVSPTGSASSVELLHYLAISAAEKEIIIQNPYFLPDPEAIEALSKAVERGVKVMIMMPSDEVNDSPVVQHASHHHFGTFLKSGIRVFEYQKTLLHQKVLIIDGIWSSVGSTNFDDRSFEVNDEISVGMMDAAIAAELRKAFEDDLKYAKEWKYKEWSERSWLHKLTDGTAYLVNEQL